MSTHSSENQAYVLGVGMTKFIKPRGLRDYPDMGYEAGVKAMLDAQINYDDVEHGVACFAYGDSTSGQRIFYQFGMTSIPIVNTANACATGSVGLYLARTLVRSGNADCVLVVGVEKMKPGSLKSAWDDRASSSGRFAAKMKQLVGIEKNAPLTAQYFANAGREYMQKYGAKAEDFAEIGRISHEHSQRNPYAQFRQSYTLQEIKDSPTIFEPLTKLQCSPTSDGAAAAVIVSQKFLDARPHLRGQAILMAGQAFKTDSTETFKTSSIELVGYDMTQRAARAAMSEAGVKPGDVRVCELHDCFSTNELVLLDALEFSAPGKAHEMVRSGDITYGGKMHNLGLGGAVVVNVYKRADGSKTNSRVSDEDIAKTSWLGYNPAVEARGISDSDADRVRSRKNRNDFALGDELRPKSGL
ncbi:hypothetical protein Neosp_009239 [[Neocosmospora] mangrovei]